MSRCPHDGDVTQRIVIDKEDDGDDGGMPRSLQAIHGRGECAASDLFPGDQGTCRARQSEGPCCNWSTEAPGREPDAGCYQPAPSVSFHSFTPRYPRPGRSSGQTSSLHKRRKPLAVGRASVFFCCCLVHNNISSYEPSLPSTPSPNSLLPT